MKVILDEKLYDMIWGRIYKKYSFTPSINPIVVPFNFDFQNVCYKLNSTWDEEQENIVNDIFKAVVGSEMYALDWQHDCYEFDPNENIPLHFHYYDNNRDVEVYFPSYFPDGDYHFFISKDWKCGMLGHPWREEIYVFGNKLMKYFKDKAEELNISRS